MKKIAKRFKDLKLKHKIMIIYICIGTIPMMLLGIYMYNKERESLVNKEYANVENSLYQGVSQFNSRIAIYDNLSDYLAFNQPVTNVLTGSYESNYDMYEQYTLNIDPVLSSLQYFNPSVKKLTIYIDKDIVRHNTTVAPLSALNEDSDIAFSNLTQKIKWNADDAAGKVYSIRAMPLMEQNNINGALYLSVNYNDLFSSFAEMPQVGYGIYILDENRNVVFQTNNISEEQKGMKLSVANMLNEKRKAEDGKVSNYIIVSDKTDVDGWTVYLYCSSHVIDEGVSSLFIMVIGIIVICIFTSVVASKAFSVFVIKDIEQLKENMLSVENGNLEITVQSEAQDEVGSLIRSFGSMLSELKRLIHEVYESNLAQKKYEMTALQAQINPHFLYNSLSLINWKALEAGHTDISKLTLALSSFYRTSLNRGSNILTIEKEIENMKSYLEIQMCMHEDEFDVLMDIDDEILQYSTLNLLLQPLVENAIEHGVTLKEDGRGYIKVIGRRDEENKVIYLIVEDNGVGIEPELLESILEFKTRGYGVRNVNQRIKLYYGDEYRLTIMSQLGQGTICTIKIPMRK